MNHTVPAEVSAQVRIVVDVIKSHLEPVLLAIHLYGSALHGGLKKYSDIDLLVTLSARPNETTRRALVLELLQHSAPPAESKSLRALEVRLLRGKRLSPGATPHDANSSSASGFERLPLQDMSSLLVWTPTWRSC